MSHITTNDGVQLYYEEAGEGRPLMMIHGWTFSGRFFARNVPVLAKHARVITVDLRDHGRSGKPGHGYRVARLAADLRDLLIALDLQDTVLLGWSLGAPVIWCYMELYGQEHVAAAVFVQQSPRQYFTPDWKLGHNKCYDAETLATIIAQLQNVPEKYDEQNLVNCMEQQPSEEERKMLLDEMAMSPVDARIHIMADHTVKDWRDLLLHLNLPALMLVARQDSVFPPEGPAWVGEHMPNASNVFFEESSHMLFHDEPEKFEQVVSGFLARIWS
ncbi:alpha/beta fold hydrolase [Pontibacter silvestris]|uniref:Alpha/beta fold hydrolase n=1 Tax=Pontibacter silvestris TaxID=2305183 RepID=A0ABW4X2A6_9BACT|nr:alpha/beta hydrolase [Pontibacter silvestris]MCC9135769.1 alpha/beta hydrolase [Pontibacter silvestris]